MTAIGALIALAGLLWLIWLCGKPESGYRFMSAVAKAVGLILLGSGIAGTAMTGRLEPVGVVLFVASFLAFLAARIWRTFSTWGP